MLKAKPNYPVAILYVNIPVIIVIHVMINLLFINIAVKIFLEIRKRLEKLYIVNLRELNA